MYTCILNIGEYPQSDKGRTSIIQQHNMERRKMHILDNLHYKIYVFGSAHMKFSIGINAGPQAQLAISQSKLN